MSTCNRLDLETPGSRPIISQNLPRLWCRCGFFVFFVFLLDTNRSAKNGLRTLDAFFCRYYSHHWRTWGASFIQAAWRRYQRRRYAEHRRKEEEDNLQMALEGVEETRGNISLGATVYSARFASNAMRGIQRLRSMRAAELTRIQNIPKPTEPDFSAD